MRSVTAGPCFLSKSSSGPAATTITTYLEMRLVVRSGFINSYPGTLHTQNGGPPVRVGELKDEKSGEAGGS